MQCKVTNALVTEKWFPKIFVCVCSLVRARVCSLVRACVCYGYRLYAGPCGRAFARVLARHERPPFRLWLPFVCWPVRAGVCSLVRACSCARSCVCLPVRARSLVCSLVIRDLLFACGYRSYAGPCGRAFARSCGSARVLARHERPVATARLLALAGSLVRHERPPFCCPLLVSARVCLKLTRLLVC